MRYPAMLAATMLALGAPAATAGDDAVVVYKSLSPEVALAAAQAALKQCRNDGFQVAVAVVDRFGQAQVMLRDRYAGLPPPIPQPARPTPRSVSASPPASSRNRFDRAKWIQALPNCRMSRCWPAVS
jgi:hypothetical protein